MNLLRTLALCALSLPAFASPGDGWLSAIDGTREKGSADVEKPKISARIIAENASFTPQALNRLAVVLEQKDGWHTYWKMPGDAGLPSRFSFTVPRGFRATEPAFPLPERIRTGELVSFGYSGEALFPFRLEIPRQQSFGGGVTVRVRIEYLACRDMCVPGETTASITLPTAVIGQPGENAARVAAAFAQIPEAAEMPGVTAEIENDNVRIRLPAEAGIVHGTVDFLPLDDGVFRLGASPVVVSEMPENAGKAEASPQESSPAPAPENPDAAETAPVPAHDFASPDRLIYLKTTEAFAREPAASIRGVLVSDNGPGHGGWAVETTIPLKAGVVEPPALSQSSPTAEPVPVEPEAPAHVSISTLSALLLAFVGGLILNLMPCVFPVLSLKLLQLVEGAKRGENLLSHGIAFTAGVLLTMLVLSGTLMALRGAGAAVGWGFQLQSPVVVSFLMLLFAVISLNLFGVFEFTAGSRVANLKAVRRTAKSGVRGSFFTGVLAVIVASPCTAPFMGAALGYALTQPAPEAIAVFLSLGFGMALPWLLLCVFPAWAKKLPRPGAWMETFRRVMAVPMLLALVWLGWVLSKQIDYRGLLVVLCGLAASAVFCWLLGREQWGLGKNRIAMTVMALLAVIAVAVSGAEAFRRSTSGTGSADWAPWSEAAVSEALAQGHPVFVDFTAAWCMTCQANKVAVLNREEVLRAMDERGVVRFRGDWTNRDGAITAVLERFHRSGVPLYLLYRTDGRVEVLPELLTTGTVLDAVKK